MLTIYFFLAQRIFLCAKSKSDFDEDPMGADPMKDPIQNIGVYGTIPQESCVGS